MPTTRHGRQTSAPVLRPRAAGSTNCWTRYSVVTPPPAKSPVDTSLAHVPVESGPSQEDAILDEDGEGEPEAEDDSEARDACSQELFSTPEEPSQSQQSDLGEEQTGEEAPLFYVTLEQHKAAEHTCQIAGIYNYFALPQCKPAALQIPVCP
ncbi:hypothetical protein UY3_11103 [Chelonia mydas]|uniref:Uncharacterized protein n=1 Tax=Chelonia mydas TaxID=8469 RepID=M7BI66_CHEMY|nr:hypothetical protein UY3_11103 [Chelonia mydas]